MELTNSSPSFVIKGNMLTIIVLQLLSTNTKQFIADLKTKLDSSPAILLEIPLILCCEQVTFTNADDLSIVLQACRKAKLKIVAVICNDENLIKVAKKNKLATFTNFSQTHTYAKELENTISNSTSKLDQKHLEQLNETQPNVADIKSITKTNTSTINNPCKIIDFHVRSGMEIVAKNSDLVILSAVSVGAELIADGNIYVYGTLRGRAYAGNSGNNNAQIFCNSLQAELISIAGVYEIADNLRHLKAWQNSSYISLQDDQLIATCF